MPKCEAARAGEWCGLCYEGSRGKASHSGHLAHARPPTRRPTWGPVWVGDAMKKPVTASKGGKGPKQGACPDEAMAKRWPTIVEFLTVHTYDDGSPRERSALSLFIEDGTVKAAMNDKDLQQSLYVAAESLEAVLDGLERHLATGKGDWRAWKRGKGK